jgi:S1-C subfamily serine protease
MMIRLLLVVCALLAMSAGSQCFGDQNNMIIETQVLRVFAVKNASYYHKPWKSPDFSEVRGSGFFFKDEKNFPGKNGLIITNAHAVSMAQSIKVSNGREKRRYVVNVVGICDSADFAVLQMEPEELATYERINGKIVPLELGDSDKLRVGDKVQGWGYPLGGEGISKSDQGEISRIEVKTYAHSDEMWLMVQASLQQNRGNSGGPVLKDGKVMGVSFQGMRASDRINFFIPINLVQDLFPTLDHPGLIPAWRFLLEHMFPRLKDFYKLGPDQGGVLLIYIIPDGGPYKFGLREKDILTEIDGHAIDNFGEIYFQPLEQKVFFGEILNRKRVGDRLSVKLIRDGKPMELAGRITRGLPKLVPRIFTGADYFIFGGVGFVELTLNCIDNLGKSGDTFRAKYLDEFPKHPYEKVVIISEIFPEYGLTDTSNYLKRVEKIDGRDILNVEDLYDSIQSAMKQGKKKALVQIAQNVQLPLDLENAEALDKSIQKKYGILYMKTPGGFKK